MSLIFTSVKNLSEASTTTSEVNLLFSPVPVTITEGAFLSIATQSSDTFSHLS